MDYEFRRDLYGRYLANLSMGHEAFGVWLTEEIGTDSNLIHVLLDKVEQLQNGRCSEHRLSGKTFTLSMNLDAIEIRANLLDDIVDELPEEPPEDLNFYDQESQASCGVDDFHQLLEAWSTFIKTPGLR